MDVGGVGLGGEGDVEGEVGEDWTGVGCGTRG